MSEKLRSQGKTGRMAAVGLVLALLGGGATGCLSAGEPTPEVPGRDQLLRQALARRDVGVDHLSKGRVALAIRELRHASALNPNDPETLLWLGEGYRRKGRLEEAETYILEALELDASHHEARINLSALLIQSERYEESITQSNLLYEDPIFPTPWRSLTNRGWAELKLRRVQEARASFEEALDFKSDYWPALLNLGILEKAEGHPALALDHFQEVLGYNPNYSARSEANYRIGEIFVTLGRRGDALDHFAEATESWPSGPWSKQSKRYLNLMR